MKPLVFGLLLAATIAGCSRAGGSPEGVVEEVMRAGETGRCDGLAENFSSSSRQMIGPKLEEGCRRAQEAKAKGDAKGEKTLSKLNVLDRQENGDRVTLRLQPDFTDGSKGEPQTFVLVKEEGRWRIDLVATGMANGGNGGLGGSTGPGGAAPAAPAPAPMATNMSEPAAPAANAAAPAEDEGDQSENTN